MPNINELLSKMIRWGFLLLFFGVPLVFTSSTSELFEFNKMMLTYSLTVIIVSSWLIKMILESKSLKFKVGPIGIVLVIYLVSHVLSTIFSIDPHVSIWGYYSRFNEGLLASLSYVLLYFAAINNLSKKDVTDLFRVSFVSAMIVSIWGALEHFGHSPSCQIFTGSFGVDCWVQDVKNRVYATLGQPNWMAAYLDIVIIIIFGFIFTVKEGLSSSRTLLFRGVFAGLFFAALLFTKSRSGILGLGVGLVIFVSFWLVQNRLLWKGFWMRSLRSLTRMTVLIIIPFLMITAIFGLPFGQTEKFSLENFLSKSVTNSKPVINNPEINISESGDIRKIVWTGAIKIWQRYPILGSGVETFAYAYYLDRPIEHNMVSEWDFLYNKAHNEYLNLLATTGTIGFLAYFIILGAFALWFIQKITAPSKQGETLFVITGLFAAWISILVTNFFGFSVVIIGLFFFLIPGFCYILSQEKEEDSLLKKDLPKQNVSTSGWLMAGLICFVGLILQINLLNIWQADEAYATGKNLSEASQYVNANTYLANAVSKFPGEPTFTDALSFNESILATLIYGVLDRATDEATVRMSKEEKISFKIPSFEISVSDLINEAIHKSDASVAISPKSLPFWKSRTKMFYQLATIDPKYYENALASIKTASELAPTDAKIWFNLGLLFEKTNQLDYAIATLEKTALLKPDYRDVFFSLGNLYKRQGNMEKARSHMQYILDKIGPDEQAIKWMAENK